MARSWIIVSISIAATVLAALAYFAVRRDPLPPINDGRDYVDSSACAGCHRQIWNSYRRSGMGRSFARVTAEIVGGSFTVNNTFHHAASDRNYLMTTRDGRYYQRRSQMGFGGKEDNVVEKEIHYVVGSGNHARTYLHRTPEGRLFELPVAWYSEKGGHWAMNPGFDTPRHPDFRRQLMYECVFCHTGYPRLAPGADAGGREPLFPERMPEGIDCQRCHGPGRAHIEAVAQGRPDQVRASIVNPARLPSDRQIEVCMQCHLETTSSRLPHRILRAGGGAFSYRPGTPLADFELHFDHRPGAGYDDKFEIAHQAYRLRKSACFLKSNNRLTCTSCHNPHVALRGEEATRHYQAVCSSCHTALSPGAAHNAQTGCLDCHMPKRRPDDVVNVVMTDHYIRRNPARPDLTAPLRERADTPETWYRGPVVPYYPERLNGLPDGDFYLAIAQVKQANNLAAGTKMLEEALRRNPGSPAVFSFELAEAYGKADRNGEAVAVYRQVTAREPDFRPAWLGLGRSLSKSEQHAQAVEALEKAASIGPPDPIILNDLGLGYLGAGRRSDALRAFRQAVALDADNAEAQYNLGGALRESGDAAGAEEAYRNAVRAQPDFTDARHQLANVLSARDSRDAAEYQYQKAIALGPDSAALRQDFAATLAAAERYDRALEQFEAALRLDPKSGTAYLGKADMLALQGRIGQAISHYQHALALEPGSGAAHLGLASALAAQGRRAEAIAHLQNAARSSDPAVSKTAREALQSLH